MPDEYKDFVNLLKDRTNIVSVVREYVDLEKRNNLWWGCCPFHRENTPSFSVNEEGRYYHCFGCGAGGDVIKFVQEVDGLSFSDAVASLAERAKMEVPTRSSSKSPQEAAEAKRRKDAAFAVMEDCAKFYADNLNSGKAAEYVDYLVSRKVRDDIIREFRLGASLDYSSLPAYLASKGYSRRDMLDSGAVSETDDGRLIDAQGQRLIFPIIDIFDRPIAFGGRLLKKSDRAAKYKNTRDTAIFDKSSTLYNVNLLRKLKKGSAIKDVVIVEGYMDVLAVYGAGYKNVVASMGTSLTQNQARVLKRYTKKALICYDADAAGQTACLRGLDILSGEGLEVDVVPLPGDEDPDDVVKRHGRDGFGQCLDRARPLVDFKIANSKKGLDISKSRDKQRYISDALKVIRQAASESSREEKLKDLSRETGISYESLKKDLDSGGAALAETQREEERAQKSSKPVSGVEKASRAVTAAFLFEKKCSTLVDISDVPNFNEVHRTILSFVKTAMDFDERVRPDELLGMWEDGTPESAELSRVFDYNDGEKLEGETGENEFLDCFYRLKEEEARRLRERHREAFAAAATKEERDGALREIIKYTDLQKKYHEKRIHGGNET